MVTVGIPHNILSWINWLLFSFRNMESLTIGILYQTSVMADITSTHLSKKNGINNKSGHRRSTKVDLTPMVDLGFLLITFFVFTTSMAEPKAMSLLEAHDGEFRPVMASQSMTILLGKKHQVFYYHGELDNKNAKSQINKTNLLHLRELIVDQKKNSDPKFLMYVIKTGKESTFGDHINVLDEMQICDIKSGHYAEADITKEEAEVLEANN